MKDMRDIQEAFEPNPATQDENAEVCGKRIPSAEELWDTIKSSPGAVWEKASGYYDNLPAPDFSATWQWFVAHLSWE
ncbi:MAG: hypothetical protein WBO29_01010 [Albidovulum sp.]